MNAVINLRFPYNARDFLTWQGTVSFSRETVFQGFSSLVSWLNCIRFRVQESSEIIVRVPKTILAIDQLNNNNNNNNNNIYLLQLGCHPVAVVILHVYKILNCLLLNLSREGYMRSM